MSILKEFIDGGPGCMRDDCFIQEQDGSSTLAYYPPTYNKQGININPDMNTHTYSKRCLSCGKGWSESYQNGIKISNK